MKKINYLIILVILFVLSINNVYASTTYKRGIVISSSAIYSEPLAQSTYRLKSDTGGSISLYSPEAVEVIGLDNNYYQIKFLYNGFVYKGYIGNKNIIVEEYKTDDEYEASLINDGFPSEYAKKLAILHAIHPNWTFTASMTGGINGGMDFTSAVEGESRVISNNLIDGKNTSLRSTADGAYKNGEWIGLSGKNWFAASKQTIAFYLDPRNFLDESHIFMFENLGYNPKTQTSEVVSRIIGSSFMKNPFMCLEGANMCEVGSHTYVDVFMKAGQDKNVSPVHLASRVIQEQGSKGSVLSLGKGYNGEYVGYYNFFNIGASGKTDEAVITNGFKYAVARNWNNPFASIYDGSTTIASGYVARGQSTLYYQKFNTIVKSYFGHEYMQNVRAPYSESYNTYTGYYKTYDTKEEWDKASYDFLIPIYSNMGDATSLDAQGNDDATLKSLTITNCNLNPEFQSSAYEYDCYVSEKINKLELSGEATNRFAKVTIPNEVTLKSKEETINIKVVAANGNSANYIINVHQIETDGYKPEEILNGIGLKVNEELLSNIEVGSDVSNIINSVTNKYHFAKVNVVDTNNNTIKDGVVKTGYKITISNAGVSKTYDMVLYGDTTGDGLIDIRDLLVIQKHLVKDKLLTGNYIKSSDINKDGTIDIRDLLLVQKYLVGQYSISQG